MELDHDDVIVIDGDSDCPERKSSPASILSASTDLIFGYLDRPGSCPSVEFNELFQIRGLAQRDDKLPTLIMDENAGRNISEIVFHIVPSEAWPHLVENPYDRTVVILIGLDNALSRVALATGRHLHDRGFRVVACDLDEGRFPGTAFHTATKSEDVPRFFGEVQYWDETCKLIRSKVSPPRLIIDALGHRTLPTALERESAGQMCAWKNTLYAMITAVNRSRSPTLSINCPTGINPRDGSVLFRDGVLMAVRSQYIASCGVPLHALLLACDNPAANLHIRGWYVCDIGINAALSRYTYDRYDIARRVVFRSGWWTQLLPRKPYR